MLNCPAPDFRAGILPIPVTFQDVAACFSEEEWKLLHEWQKELYKNVMKEIHQAMIALGPLIAMSVFALGPKEKEDLYDVDHQEDETGNDINQNTGNTTGNYEVSFGINLEEDLYEDNPVETDRRTSANHASTVYHPLHVENVPRADQCCKSILVDHQNAEAERSICPNIGHMDMMSNLSLAIKEETTYTKFHQHPDGQGNSSTLRNTGVSFREHPTQDQREVSTVASSAVAQIVTFPLKEDDPSRFMDSLDSEIQENFRRPTEAGGQGNRTKKHSTSAHSDQMPPCTAFHGNSKSGVLQSPSKIPNCRWQWLSETNQELRGEKNIQIESAFSASVDSHAHLEAPTLMGPDKCNEDSENISSEIHQTYQPTTKQISRSYNSTEYEKRLRQTKDLFKHRRTYNCLYAKIPPKFTTLKPMRNAPMYQCYYCAKKFNHKGHFTTHIRTHTKERPFPCNECEKSFNTKGNLNSHKRMHTGERPYHCTQCEKSFSQQGHLSRHYKSHHTVQNTSG